jgi:hypothetical protein
LQAAVHGGLAQNIHVTDILTTQLLTALQIHLGEPAGSDEASVSSKGFFPESADVTQSVTLKMRDPSVKWVGIQLPESREGRSATDCSAEGYAKLARLILEKHADCRIALLGSEAAAACEEALFRGWESSSGARDLVAAAIRSGRVVSWVGESFEVWAAVVGRCQWVISGPGPVLALSAILGTRCVALASRPGRWLETGPYGNGHYVIAPAVPKDGVGAATEGEAGWYGAPPFGAELVYRVWNYASTEWAHRRELELAEHLESSGLAEELSRIAVYRSRIRGSDDGGGVTYEPQLRRALRLTEWNAQVLGHVARSWYCGWTPPVGQEVDRLAIGPALVQGLRALAESVEVLAKVCEEAKRTALELHRRSSALRSPRLMTVEEQRELSELNAKLVELDGLLERLGKAQPALELFPRMGKVLQHNLRGETVAELSRESAESYQQLLEGAMVVSQWITKTLGLVRPELARSVMTSPPPELVKG